MIVVQDVVTHLERIAPGHLSEDWDNTGLLIGRPGAQVQRLLTCLTLTSDVAAEAVAEKVQLVVAHHPLMFRGTKRITEADREGRVLLQLIENGIAVYSPHTSFDSALQGINQQLATAFGLQKIHPIRTDQKAAYRESAAPAAASPAAGDEGAGRHGTLEEAVSLQAFLETVRTAVSKTYLEYSGDLQASVRYVAVACGAAAEFLSDAMRLGCDTFVTGEARFHAALEARECGINLILLGHYSSERPGIEWLAEQLGAAFSEIQCFPSSVERDPLQLFTS